MSNTIKNIVVSVCFLLLLFGFAVANLLCPDTEISQSERRHLAQAPTFNWETVMDGSFMENLDSYSLDQFVLRDSFRTLKAFTRFSLLQQKDNNGIFIAQGHIGKLEYPLNEDSLAHAAERFQWICQTYLPSQNLYYAIIPDKSYVLAPANGYPHLDYDRLVAYFQENLDGMTYIDLFPYLSADDYYRTDGHWRQEKILDIAQLLLDSMGTPNALTLSLADYRQETFSPFYGVYFGQSALPIPADTIYYLVNDQLLGLHSYNYETEQTAPIYDLGKTQGMDPYDLFLSGATPIIEIENPKATSRRELYIFRDSFASSLAPLLMNSYAKITLIDIRYIAPNLLGDYIEFTPGADALFLYSTTLLNQSGVLK